jgi:hypothetical protein
MPSESDIPAQKPEVVDPLDCQVTFADWIATVGCYDNVANITFGAIDHAITGSNNLPRIIVTSRLRFSREFGVRLHKVLGNVLGINPEGEPSEPEPTPIPPNRLN